MRFRIRKIMAFVLVLAMCAPSVMTYASEVEPASEPSAYTVTLSQTEHGALAFPDSEEAEATADEGNKVIIKASPDEGFGLTGITVSNSETGEALPLLIHTGNESQEQAEDAADVLNVICNEDGTISFAMPGMNVTVSAAFSQSTDIPDTSQSTPESNSQDDSIEGKSVQEDVLKEAETAVKDNDEVIFDAVAEGYIKKNVNKDYAGSGDMELVNAILVKNSIFDDEKVSSDETIDEIMSKEDFTEKYITMSTSVVPVYDLGKDGKYLAAYVDTMHNDNNSSVTDAIFAKNNTNGEVVSDCIYDYQTGIAYIPKKDYVATDNEGAFLSLQIQLLQLSNIDNRNSNVVTTVEEDGEQKTNVISADLYDYQTTVNIGKGKDMDDYTVSVNGAPVSDELYDYDKKTGNLTVNESSSSISSISVNEEDKNIISKIKDIFEPLSVNAMSYDDMDWFTTTPIELPDGIGEGSYFTGEILYAYGAGDVLDYPVYEYPDAQIQSLANLICSGGSANPGIMEKLNHDPNIVIMLDGCTFSCNGYQPDWSSLRPPQVGVRLMCAHVSNPLGAGDSSGTVGGNYSMIGGAMRILNVNEENGYMIVGVLTKTTHRQAGIGILKMAIASKGKLNLTKSSANESLTDGNSCYSLENATYGVYSDAGCTSQVGTLTTNADGNTGEIELKRGTYYVKELSAPKGYALDTTVYQVQVYSNQTSTVSVSDKPLNDPAAIELEKIDKETGGTKSPGGYPLEGAQFTVKFYAGMYDTVEDLPAEADRTWVIETKEAEYEDHSLHYITGLSDYFKVGGDDFYYENGQITLPLGTVTVEETKAPEGYKLEGKYLVPKDGEEDAREGGVYLQKVEQVGDMANLVGGNELTSADQIVRGDLHFSKTDKSNNAAMPNIPFKITNVETGETHTVYTDVNGYYSSEASYVSHLTDTNSEAMNTGTWFGGTEPDDTLGAFPYGTYTIEELPCEENEGKFMFKDSFTIDHDTFSFNIGTIENSNLGLMTTAKDEASGTHYAMADDEVTIIDKVEYYGLDTSKTYTLKGTLMLKSLKTPVLNDGKPVTVEKEVKPYDAHGSLEMEFLFDATGLAGQDVVVFEELYDEDDNLITKHADYYDEEQTINFPGIGTNAADSDTKVELSKADKEATIVDTVKYTNLRPGRKYTLKGVLIDKATGKEAKDPSGDKIEAETTFTPETADGTAKVTFTFDASKMEGKTLVVYESLIRDERTYAEHKNLNDKGQTILFPQIRTSAVDSDTNVHVSRADNDMTIIDTVTYKNLTPGKTYSLIGTLMDKATGEQAKDDAGAPIKAEASFTPNAADGTAQVTFHFSGKCLENTDVVVFEELLWDGKSIAEHKDIEDEGQTLSIPKIRTSVLDSDTKDHVSFSDDDITITDTVSYWNLIPGQEYTVNGKLIDKETGNPVKDAKGEDITASTTFTAKEKDGTADVVFTFDGSSFAGVTGVVYENLLMDGKSVAIHEDKEDEKQTEYFPDIHTNVIDSESGINASFADDSITVTDTVSYSHLLPGKKYVVTGILMDKATEAEAKDGAGKKIEAQTEFTAEEEEGEVEVTFTFDGTGLENHTFVVYETLYLDSVKDSNKAAEHKDLTDEAQSVHIPEIGTKAADSETDLRVSHADDSITIVDTVEYKNLIPGKEYKVSGVLMDKDTKEPMKDSKGGQIEAEAAFTPDTADGMVDVTFTFDGSTLAGNTLTAFETLTYNSVILAEHKDIEDEDQTVYIPEIHTTAIDSDTEDHISYADDKVTIVDTVDYTNLLPGVKYTMKGRLMDKATGEAVLDAAGHEVTAESTLTPDKTTGSVEVTFTFDASGINPKALVAFEQLFVGEGNLVAEHEDIDDEEQGIELPKIHTKAIDSDSKINASFADKEITVVDTVTYENLLPGKKYVVTGVLMDQNTGKEAVDGAGKKIDSEATFEAKAEDGEAEVTFTFNGEGLENHTFVVYESLYLGSVKDKNLVADHKDLTDEAQSVHIPEIGTQAYDTETGLRVSAGDEDIVIVDTVEYKNLVPGYQYRVTGVLMDKATGKEALDDYHSRITAEAFFTPDTPDGTVDVTFTFSGASLKGSTLTAFEELYYNSAILAEHKDIEDEDQTVYIPEIGTTALDSDTKDHISYADGSVTIVDTVKYTDLLPGVAYEMSGTLMDKSTGEAFLDANGNEVKAKATFTPSSPDGSVDVTFTFNGTGLTLKTMVAFEELSVNGIVLTTHSDIEDKEQSVQTPEIRTKALDDDTGLPISCADEDIEITDTVIYRNLLPGKEYTASGVFTDKETGNVILDADGNPVKAEATFTPETANGTVDVHFRFDGRLLKSGQMVAFEELYLETADGRKIVADHKDSNDESQTITVPAIGTQAADGENGTKMSFADEEIVITDKISYEGLLPGYQYEVTGTLMDKSTGEPALDDNGKEIAAQGTFTAEAADGETEVTFTFSGETLKGAHLVAFEDVYLNGKLVAAHHDIEDEDQTTMVPTLKTFANDMLTKTQQSQEGREVTVTDDIQYKNLEAGRTYIVRGTLYDVTDTVKDTEDTDIPETDTEDQVDENQTFGEQENQMQDEAQTDDVASSGKYGKAKTADGKEITWEQEFKTEAEEGTVTTEFTFNAEGMEGKTLILNESIYLVNEDGTEEFLVALDDMTDKDQMLYFPVIRTTASDADDGDKNLKTDDKVSITDEVTYQNLVPGKEYKITGTLMDKNTNSAVMVNGAPVTAETAFTPEKPDGSVKVMFEFDGRAYEGRDLVVFEKLFLAEAEVTNHEDITDASQTVHLDNIPKPVAKTKTGDNDMLLYLSILCLVLLSSGAILTYRKRR